MGAKVKLIWSSGIESVIYLTTAAIEWYQRNNVDVIILHENIPDDIINIFHMSSAVTLKEGATYQELLNYYLLAGMLRADAVAKAQSQIGISKETLIKTLDVFQADIIADKAAKIEAAAHSIEEQTDTQKTTFEEIDLSQFGDSAPKINTETNATENLRNLPRTTGDISSDALDFQVNTQEIRVEEKTREENKDTVVKGGDSITVIPTKKDSDPKDFKSFGLNTKAAIIGIIILSGIFAVLYYVHKKGE